VLKALATDPNKRYSTARALQVALEGFAANSRLPLSTAALARFAATVIGDKSEPWREFEDFDYDEDDEDELEIETIQFDRKHAMTMVELHSAPALEMEESGPFGDDTELDPPEVLTEDDFLTPSANDLLITATASSSYSAFRGEVMGEPNRNGTSVVSGDMRRKKKSRLLPKLLLLAISVSVLTVLAGRQFMAGAKSFASELPKPRAAETQVRPTPKANSAVRASAIVLTVQAAPRDATVTFDGTVAQGGVLALGTEPRGGELIVEHAGYATYRQDITVDKSQIIAIELQPAPPQQKNGNSATSDDISTEAEAKTSAESDERKEARRKRKESRRSERKESRRSERKESRRGERKESRRSERKESRKESRRGERKKRRRKGLDSSLLDMEY
jgi:hypothetical protein